MFRCRRSGARAWLVRASLIVLAAALGGRHVVSGQAPAASAQPTFRSGVQIVEVDVRVFDRSGQFVSGLTRDDFELVENGEPQTIDALHLVGADPVAAPDSASRSSVSSRSSPAAAPVAPQTWILFFDTNHLTPGGGFDRARAAVEGFIRDRFPAGDLAGIVAGDKMVNNRITSVKGELLEAVRQVKPRSDARMRWMELTGEWPRLLDDEEAIRIARNEIDVVRRATGRACADDPDFCRAGDPEPNVRAKAQRMQQEAHRMSGQTLAALNALAAGLARVPGPKTLVLLSDGFVTQDIESTLRSVVGQTTRAGGRVYAIDVRGLNRTANPGIVEQAQVEDAFGAVPKFDGLADGPNSLAIDTGGLMIRNENNLGRALDRIADDSGRYYVLAYQPSNASFDGSYRPIQVRVKREALRVRARRGYLALPPSRLLLPQPIVPTVASAAAPAAATASEAPPDPEPEERAAAPLPVTAPGVAVPLAAAAPAAGIRLRPDVEGRVNALSSLETAAKAALATAGWEAYQRGDVESALAAFVKAAAEPGVRPWVLYALGMSQAALGQATEAIRSWERVRQAVPDFQPVYMDLADAYASLSDLTSALAVVRQAEVRWPASADVHSAIGVILVRRGALDDGIAALVKTTDLNPGDGLAYLNLGRAYALRYQRGRRYVTSQRRWIAPEDDRKRAVEALDRSVKLGGPYATQAREELTYLQWSKQG
ncbi:MAG: VWA domain-containing protein [Vicinamibacterales bacterium]